MSIFKSVHHEHSKKDLTAKEHTQITKDVALVVLRSLKEAEQDLTPELLDRLETKIQEDYREYKSSLIKQSN